MSFGAYLTGVLGLAAIAVAMGLVAVRIRGRLLPGWEGAPARLVEAVIGLSALTLLLQLLGAIGLFEPAVLVGASIAVGGRGLARRPARPADTTPAVPPSPGSRPCRW